MGGGEKGHVDSWKKETRNELEKNMSKQLKKVCLLTMPTLKFQSSRGQDSQIVSARGPPFALVSSSM